MCNNKSQGYYTEGCLYIMLLIILFSFTFYQRLHIDSICAWISPYRYKEPVFLGFILIEFRLDQIEGMCRLKFLQVGSFFVQLFSNLFFKAWSGGTAVKIIPLFKISVLLSVSPDDFCQYRLYWQRWPRYQQIL